jgi:hypothetical protein
MKNQIISWIIGLSGAGAAWFAWIKVRGSKIVKFIGVARHVFDLLDDFMEASKDGSISAEDVAKLRADIQSIKDALK